MHVRTLLIDLNRVFIHLPGHSGTVNIRSRFSRIFACIHSHTPPFRSSTSWARRVETNNMFGWGSSLLPEQGGTHPSYLNIYFLNPQNTRSPSRSICSIWQNIFWRWKKLGCLAKSVNFGHGKQKRPFHLTHFSHQRSHTWLRWRRHGRGASAFPNVCTSQLNFLHHLTAKMELLLLVTFARICQGPSRTRGQSRCWFQGRLALAFHSLCMSHKIVRICNWQYHSGDADR